MPRKIFNFDPPRDRWLVLRAKRLGISMSEVIKRLVDEEMKREQKEKDGK